MDKGKQQKIVVYDLAAVRSTFRSLRLRGVFWFSQPRATNVSAATTVIS
jgi:hypothetical protein